MTTESVAQRLHVAEYESDAIPWTDLPEVIKEAWRQEARKLIAADVIEIPLPPEPDRSRRLEAYDPGTGKVRGKFDYDRDLWIGNRGHWWGDWPQIVKLCMTESWRLRSVPRTDGGEQG